MARIAELLSSPRDETTQARLNYWEGVLVSEMGINLEMLVLVLGEFRSNFPTTEELKVSKLSRKDVKFLRSIKIQTW